MPLPGSDAADAVNRGHALPGSYVRPPQDPERDERVRAYRAADARRAGRALDRLLIELGFEISPWQRDVIVRCVDAHIERRLHHNGHYGVEHDGHCLKAGGECSPEAEGDFRRGDRVCARAESMAPGYHPKVLTVSYVMPIEGTGNRTPLRWQFKAEELPGVWMHCDEYVQHNGDYGATPDPHPGRSCWEIGPDCGHDPCAGGRCPDREAHAEGAHDV